MQDISLATKNRAPSSQVLQEVIRRASAEYVTQSSTQFRPPAPNVTGSLKLTAGGYFFHLGHNRSFSARNAGRPAVREHLEDSTPIHVRGHTLSSLEARDGRAWGGSYTTRLQRRHRFFPHPVRGRNAQCICDGSDRRLRAGNRPSIQRRA